MITAAGAAAGVGAAIAEVATCLCPHALPFLQPAAEAKYLQTLSAVFLAPGPLLVFLIGFGRT